MTRLLQITDCHVVHPTKLVSGRLNTSQLLSSALERIRDDLPKVGPVDGIVVTGDVSDDGSAQSYEIFSELIDSLEMPLFVIPGNHDCRETMRAHFFASSDKADSERLNWVHYFDDLQLIGLDTIVPRSGGGLIDNQTVEFLTNALSASDLPALIALHHPPFASGVNFMDAITLRGSDKLEQVLNAANKEVRLICGHLHTLSVGALGRHVAVSSPATCSSFEVDYRGDAPVGYTTKPGGYMVHDNSTGFRSTLVPFTQGSGPHPF